jgi:hypothetical protein
LSVEGKLWKLARDVTIAPAADLKGPVRWRLPDKTRLDQIVVLNNVEGLTLRGIDFDGEGRVQDAILLTGRCPGLTLEDVTVRGFQRSGLLVVNCAGASGKPITIFRLLAITTNPATAAIDLDLNTDIRDPSVNQYLTFRECRFEGPSETPLKFNPLNIKDVVLPDWYGR